MNRPKISIVIPLYNKENAIQSTLKSILNNQWQDFEIIIVDDGSTDNSIEKVREIEDSRIRLITQSNKGPSAARNTGAKAAFGEWILFFDADDILYPDGLSTLMIGTDNPNVTVVNAVMDLIDDNNNIILKKNRHYNGLVPQKQNFRLLFFKRLTPRSNNTLLRKDFILNHLFNEDLVRFEDSEAAFRWAKNGTFYVIDKSVAALRAKYRDASFPNPDNFQKDWGSHLCFQHNNFWGNCYLALILKRTLNGYPNRQEELRNKYNNFLSYLWKSDILWKLGRLAYRDK